MRRLFELIVLVGTAGILVATSQAQTQCANETVNLRANTTCGPTANLAVNSASSCAVSATGADFAGLPTLGSISGSFTDAGVSSGFQLAGFTADGGELRNCTATPKNGAFTIVCNTSCGDPDAGICEPSCSGTLTPQ